MAFLVEIAPRAYDDLDEIADYIERNGSFEQAEQWFNGVVAAIAALSQMPNRCPIAAESEELGQVVRRLLYGKRNRKYKTYYTVRHATSSNGTVQVFHVRHWARRSLTTGELRELMRGSAKLGKK